MWVKNDLEAINNPPTFTLDPIKGITKVHIFKITDLQKRGENIGGLVNAIQNIDAADLNGSFKLTPNKMMSIQPFWPKTK